MAKRLQFTLNVLEGYCLEFYQVTNNNHTFTGVKQYLFCTIQTLDEGLTGFVCEALTKSPYMYMDSRLGDYLSNNKYALQC